MRFSTLVYGETYIPSPPTACPPTLPLLTGCPISWDGKERCRNSFGTFYLLRIYPCSVLI